MKYNTSMFDSIKDALNKQQQKQGGGSKDILTMEKGNTYVVRLIPNLADPEKTWFKYQSFSWTSFATGKFVSSISPLSWGERDPIAEERIQIYKNGTDAEKEKIKNVRRTERWLMRAYIVSDPTTPENNGKVKILRLSKQVFNIINSAISGEDADEFGARIFDLGPNGVNFKIKVTDQGGFHNYTESRFTSPVNLKLTEAQTEEIYAQAGGLEHVYSARSSDEIKKVFDEHYHTEAPAAAAPSTDSSEETETSAPPADAEDLSDEEKMKRLLADM